MTSLTIDTGIAVLITSILPMVGCMALPEDPALVGGSMPWSCSTWDVHTTSFSSSARCLAIPILMQFWSYLEPRLLSLFESGGSPYGLALMEACCLTTAAVGGVPACFA